MRTILVLEKTQAAIVNERESKLVHVSIFYTKCSHSRAGRAGGLGLCREFMLGG